MGSPETRINEIKTAVDEFLRRVTRWTGDPQGGAVVPESIVIALENANLTCSAGDIPDSCRCLAVVAIPRMVEEYRRYELREHGCFRPENGSPGPSFWAAAKKVAEARQGAEAPLIEQLEPIYLLIEQGVTNDQIAGHIYGRRGEGPFMQANGTPNVSLIIRQANYEKDMLTKGESALQPVIPSDWVPPWHKEAVDRQKKELQSQLKAFDRLETGKRYDDPASVEELLQEGAFVQQIERVKGVTREHVLEVAKRIGVKAVDGPAYRPSLSYANEDDDSLIDDGEDDSPEDEREALKELIIELHENANGTKGSAEIAAELKRAGHDVSTNKVSAVVGHYKKGKQPAAPAPATV